MRENEFKREIASCRRSNRLATRIHVDIQHEDTLHSPETTPRDDAGEKMLVESLLERCQDLSSRSFGNNDDVVAKNYDSAFMRNKQRDRLNDYIKISRHIVQKVKSGQSLKASIDHQQRAAREDGHRSTVALANACISSVGKAKQTTRAVGFNSCVYLTTPTGGYLVVDHGDLVIRSRHSCGKKRELFTIRPDPWHKADSEELSSDVRVAFEVRQAQHQYLSSVVNGSKVSVRLVNWKNAHPSNTSLQSLHSHLCWHIFPIAGKAIRDNTAVYMLQYIHLINNDNPTAHYLGHDLQLHKLNGKGADRNVWKIKLQCLPSQPTQSTHKAKPRPVIYPLSRPQSRYREWNATRTSIIEQHEHDIQDQIDFDKRMCDEFREYATSNSTIDPKQVDKEALPKTLSPIAHHDDVNQDLNDGERLKILQCYNPSVYGRLQPTSRQPSLVQPRTTKYLRFLIDGMEKIGERRPKSAAIKKAQPTGFITRPKTAPAKHQLRLGKVASQ